MDLLSDKHFKILGGIFFFFFLLHSFLNVECWLTELSEMIKCNICIEGMLSCTEVVQRSQGSQSPV